tara:strand:- start:2966 stop:3325 length:360 start_codon:yes stop_codon:yes gene_type:complete
MIKSDVILKLYDSAINSNLEVEEEETSKGVLGQCKDYSEQILEYKELNAAFVKTKKGDEDYIRMVFELKPPKNSRSKVQNIERIVQLIKSLEKTLVVVNKCSYDLVDGDVYLDAVKLVN